MATTPKILVQYSPKDAVSEAVPDLEKIKQATRTFEYQARDFSFTTLLQRIATDFKLDGNINLLDNDGNRVRPEILKKSVELTELRVEGSGPVATYVQPRERVWGKIKAMCSRMTYPNVLEELIENSLDAIDIERDKTRNDFPGKIIVTTNREERSIRIRDNGSGIAANYVNLESIMALGNDDDHTGSGNGEYNEGMKTVAKFGMQELKLEVSIMSKTAASDTVVQVQLPLTNVKEHGVWNPLVGKVGPEPTLFGPSDGSCEPPFPGLHGTVVTLSHADKVVFRELCISETDPKLECLPKLAAKYCLRTTGAAEFLNDALNQSGATTTRPFTGTFKSDLSLVDIIVDRDCLRDQDNIVLERVLEILAKSDDKNAAREKLCAAQSAAEESATAGSGRVAEMPAKGHWPLNWPLKPLWFVEYKVESEASGQRETGVVKVVAFFDSAQGEPSGEEGEIQHKGPPENQVLGFWNGVFFETMSLEVVPWFNKAKMDKSNSPQVQAAYDRVKLFVFVDKAFRPDVQKQILSSGSLYTELCTDSKNSRNSKTFLSVKKALVEKVSEWFKADVTETYGPVATRRYENAQFAWEYVDLRLREGASPTSRTSAETHASKPKAGASVTRQKQDTARLWAQTQGKNGKKGSFVEFECEASGSGSTSKTLLAGTITGLITTEAEPITSGRAKIDVPFAESMEVHVSKITRLLTPGEEKARLELVKDSMPNDMAIHVFVGYEKPKNGRGIKSVTSSNSPAGQLHYLPVENSSSTTRKATSGAASRTKLLEMTADQARDFGLMVEVINGSGKLVQDGGEHGHAKNSVVNLKNLTCRIEVWDCKRKIALPHPRSGDGADWFDIVKVDNRNAGARYFSDKQQPSITDFLETVGEYQIKFFFGFRDLLAGGSDSDEDGRVFPGQRRSVQEHLDEKFRIPGEPSGLHGTLDIKIIPGKPCKAFGKVDNCYWLGDPRPLRELSIKDKFDNPLPIDTIAHIDVKCISEALPAKVQREGSVWNLIIEGVEGHALKSEDVDLDFDVLTSWTDSSIIAKALGGKGSGCSSTAGRIEPLPGKLRFRGKVQIYSGLPHSLTIKPAADMSVTGLPRGELLALTVDVKDQWGTIFRGKQGHLTLNFAVEASEGMMSSKKLTIEDLESGEVKLPEKLKARIEGDYNSTGTFKISCTVRDMRGGTVLHRADIGAENTLDVKVQEARLVFGVPDKVGESSENSDGEYELEIETRHLSRLVHTVQLQVQLPSGAVMKNVGGTALLSKVVSGKPEAEQSLPVRRGEAIAEIVDPQKIDETMPCTFRAHFHGLQAALNLWIVHGVPQSVSVGPDTEHEVMIGKEWPVFFKVLDAEKVVMRDPDMFSLSLECDDGLKFEIKEGSVAFHHEHMAFQAIAVPAGCVRSEANETNKANVRLHVRSGEQQGNGPPPPPEHDDLCPALLLKASMGIIVKAEDAVKLQFFSSGAVREEHPYESGKSLDLCIRAVDRHGNVDKSFNGWIEIVVVDSATQAMQEGVQVQGGFLFLKEDKWKQFTKAAHIQLTASHVVKNKKTHTLEPAACRLNVSLGSWAESIKVLPHPLMEGKRVVIDDSALAFEGFQACVVANDGTKISGATLQASLADRVYKSSPSEKDPSVLEFEPMEVPEKEGQWPLELTLVDDDDDKATRSPPNPGITVRRTPGKPASFALQAELDHLQDSRLNTLTVCAEKEFWLHVEAKNKLGVPLSLEELRRQDELFEVHFELLDRDIGIKLEYPRGNLEGQDASKARVGVIETAQGLCQGITTSVRGYALFQKQRVYTNSIELTFHPHLEVQKNKVAFAEVEEAMNKIQKDLETTKKTQTRMNAEHKKATAAVNGVREKLVSDKLPPMDVLQSELVEATAICEFRKGKKFLSEPDPTPRPGAWTQAYEDARREGRLPESGALGVVAGLGYVDAEGGQTLFAEGIAALAGSSLQAVVVPTEQDFAQWELFAAEREIRTLVMTPLSKEEHERVRSVLDGPPAGAHSAVGKIKVEELFVPDAALKKRLLSELWAKLLLDALIFETYPQMQAYRAQHGRTHRMAAPRADGTWCVSDVGEVPGQDAPRYVKLRVLVPGESTAEYREADRKVKEATSKMTIRKDLEHQLALKLKAAQDTKDTLDAAGCEAKIADLEAQMAKLKDQVAALRGSAEELGEGAGRAKKRSKKGGGGEGGGSSSSRASGKRPRDERQETPLRNTRQRGIASPSHGTASALQNLNLRSAAGGRGPGNS